MMHIILFDATNTFFFLSKLVFLNEHEYFYDTECQFRITHLLSPIHQKHVGKTKRCKPIVVAYRFYLD